ncbi:MAG: DUF3800 domain-containing protein [Acidobacteriota bacterium]
MQLYYLDESGTGLKDNKTPYFVLSAFGIPASDWQILDMKIVALKRRLFSYARPEDIEIKGRELRQADKMFKSLEWEARLSAIQEISQVIADLRCRIFTIRVDKRALPNSIASNDQLYRLAFSRLLEELECDLVRIDSSGLLMLDGQSDLHSSVQDRRLIDSYREWLASRTESTRLIELPWFGFSAFYVGLQLADFSAYLIDFVLNEESSDRGKADMEKALTLFRDKVTVVRIP